MPIDAISMGPSVIDAISMGPSVFVVAGWLSCKIVSRLDILNIDLKL